MELEKMFDFRSQFIDFAKKEGVYEKIKANSHVLENVPFNDIWLLGPSGLFSYSESPEGYDFWVEVESKFMRHMIKDSHIPPKVMASTYLVLSFLTEQRAIGLILETLEKQKVYESLVLPVFFCIMDASDNKSILEGLKSVLIGCLDMDKIDEPEEILDLHTKWCSFLDEQYYLNIANLN